MSHSKVFTSNISKSAGFGTGGINRLQPFCKQRRSLTRHIQSYLLTHYFKSIILERSINKTIQIVPSAKFRYVLKIALGSFTIVRFGKPIHAYTEKTSLTLTFACITDIEQTFHSQFRIFPISPFEQNYNIFFTALAKCCAQCKQIINCIQGTPQAYRTIFSISNIIHFAQTIYKTITHNTYLLFLFDFFWTEELFYIYIIIYF